MKSLKLFTCILLLDSCNCNEALSPIPGTEICVIHDVTDKLILKPVPDPILALYDFYHNENQPAIFRYVVLTDKVTTPVETITIDDGRVTEAENKYDDPGHRANSIHAFYGAVRYAIDNFPKQYIPESGAMDHSECFATISQQLNHLAISRASQKILCVFSDLSENSSFSTYRKKDLRLLEEHPERVAELLMAKHPLPKSLVGITIYFTFLPKDRDEDMRFNQMVTLYTKLLKNLGARVVIQSTNKSFAL